jgi:hypothetical protein
MALFEVRRLDQGGEVRRVIDVEVCEENRIELGHVRAGAAEFQGTATATVDEDPGTAILPDEIARGGTVVFQLRAARAQHLEFNAFVRAGCRVGGEWEGKEGDE